MAEIQQDRTFFAVRNYSQFDRASPKYSTQEIGSYSLDINKSFVDSNEYLKYYIEPENLGSVHFDLNKGFDTRMIKEKGRDINVLYWIKNHFRHALPEGQASKRYIKS